VGLSGDGQAALVALLRDVGLDVPGLAERLERCDAAELLDERLRFDGDQPRLIPDDPETRLAPARDELAGWSRAGWRLLSVRDEDYPLNLRLVHDRPPALFVAGALRPEAEQAVAVIGSREPSQDGRARAARLATDLVAAGQTVVSGLAAGIDTVAHHAAVAAGGRTVAVIGTGLAESYPAENRGLQARLAAEHAVVSPYWPETRPSAETFRRRNGVMSGIARATVIVEASAHSGTRIQARLALAHGRPVCLLWPVLRQPWATELARRPGVHVVSSAADVISIAQGSHGDNGPLLERPS
jgi:DNA processing protein